VGSQAVRTGHHRTQAHGGQVTGSPAVRKDLHRAGRLLVGPRTAQPNPQTVRRGAGWCRRGWGRRCTPANPSPSSAASPLRWRRRASGLAGRSRNRRFRSGVL